PLDGRVTFQAGRTTATETVRVLDRRGHSPAGRTVTVTLLPGRGYRASAPATATVRILPEG
ncbi:hypothetical protein, partial [Nonomuraea rubra]